MARLDLGPRSLLKIAAGAAAGGALGSTLFGQTDYNIPDGPAKRPATAIVQGIGAMNDAQVTSTRRAGKDYVIDFHLPDRDSKFPSSVNVSTKNGRITEATIRLGPLGDQSEVDREQWRNFEGEWTDVVLDAAPDSLMEDLDGTNIDLGDEWMSDQVRPHVRLHEKRAGHGIPASEFVVFLDNLTDRFERQFGRFEDRLYNEHFRRGP